MPMKLVPRLAFALVIALGVGSAAAQPEHSEHPPQPQAQHQAPVNGRGLLRLLPADSVTEHSVDTAKGRIAYTATAGTLPFYDQSGEQSAAIFYVAYIAKSFALTGVPDAQARQQADEVLAFETALAAASLSPVEERDLDNQYHFVSVAEADKGGSRRMDEEANPSIMRPAHRRRRRPTGRSTPSPHNAGLECPCPIPRSRIPSATRCHGLALARPRCVSRTPAWRRPCRPPWRRAGRRHGTPTCRRASGGGPPRCSASTDSARARRRRPTTWTWWKRRTGPWSRLPSGSRWPAARTGCNTACAGRTVRCTGWSPWAGLWLYCGVAALFLAAIVWIERSARPQAG